MNLSDRQLNLREKESLRFGLNHHILPEKVRVDRLKASIEKLASSCQAKSGIPIEEHLQTKLYFRKFLNDAKISCNNQKNRSLYKVLKTLSANESIKVCKFDEGKGTVILISIDYYAKLDQIINDSSKFTLVQASDNVHPVISKEQSIKYYIRKYLKLFDEKTVRQPLPSGSIPRKLYELMKIHEAGKPARPVISMIGSPEYELVKFLDSLIRPYIPDTSMLRSFQELLKQ